MPENEYPRHEPPVHRAELDVRECLVEYDSLDAEFDRLGELWAASKRALTQPFSSKLLDNLEEFRRELAALHNRQHDILARQAEIEQIVIDSTLKSRRT